MRRTYNVHVGTIEALDGTIEVRSLHLADGSVDTVGVHQGDDTVALAPMNRVKELASLLQQAVGDHDRRDNAPEPLRRFPALYERLRVYDEKTRDFLGLTRYATEIGAGETRSDARPYVRLDGDGGSEGGPDGVFLWDEGARAFYFKGGNHLYLIPVEDSDHD